MQMKVCSKCKRELPADVYHYHRSKNGKYGYTHHCKECRGTKFGVHTINKVLKAKDGYMFCGTCKKELPLDHDHFYRYKKSKNGWGSRCKVCWGGSYGVHQINKTYKAKEGYKYCSDCEKELPYASFSKLKENSDGRNSSCRKCESIRSKEYLQKPGVKKRRAQYAKNYRKKYYSTEKGILVNKRNIQKRRSRKKNTIYNYSM